MRFLMVAVLCIALMLGGLGCMDSINGPLVRADYWYIDGNNVGGPYPECPPARPTTAEAQLARWAWFDDETTFVYLMARVDDSGLACDQITWNVGNIARDDSTSKKPLLADILNPTAIVIHDDLPHPTAICHIARDGDAIWVLRSLEHRDGGELIGDMFQWRWIASDVGAPYLDRQYLITNPLMETLDWHDQEVQTTLRRIPQPDGYGFGAGVFQRCQRLR